MPTPAARAALAATDQFVVPHYRALAAATDAQVQAWSACKPGNDASLRAAYTNVADAWAQIEFVRTGPMVLFFRRERFDYWPEVRNATQTNLDALLASHDPEALAPATLAHDSIPAQGLSAIERLLFDAGYVRNPRRCAVGLGIARNMAAIAHDVLAAWTQPGGVRVAIAGNKSWNNNIFANADEAARMLMTDLSSAFTTMDDQKLLVPMGADIASAKPRAAEAWRSARSRRDLMLNVSALRAMEHAFALQIPAPAQRRIDAAFAAAEAAAKALPSDIGAAVANPAQRAQLGAARAILKAAQSEVVKTLAPALGIALGFNALDGD